MCGHAFGNTGMTGMHGEAPDCDILAPIRWKGHATVGCTGEYCPNWGRLDIATQSISVYRHLQPDTLIDQFRTCSAVCIEWEHLRSQHSDHGFMFCSTFMNVKTI